jgi:hypothetical protein
MKNCIILGFGRSGTSLMGGILFHSGYYLGDDLFPPRESNPLGFFETDMINGINEQILQRYDYQHLHNRSTDFEGIQSPYSPIYGQRWLSYIEPGTEIVNNQESVANEIKAVTAKAGFAYKDPRFSYTLPVWLPYLPDTTVYICMFRQPGHVVESVIKDSKTADYLEKFIISAEEISQLWYHCYDRVINRLAGVLKERLLFVHYEQLLTGALLPKLEEQLGLSLDRRFIAPELNRSRISHEVPEKVDLLYADLCRRAGM